MFDTHTSADGTVLTVLRHHDDGTTSRIVITDDAHTLQIDITPAVHRPSAATMSGQALQVLPPRVTATVHTPHWTGMEMRFISPHVCAAGYERHELEPILNQLGMNVSTLDPQELLDALAASTDLMDRSATKTELSPYVREMRFL